MLHHDLPCIAVRIRVETVNVRTLQDEEGHTMKLGYWAAGLCVALGYHSAAHGASVLDPYVAASLGVSKDNDGNYIFNFDFTNLGAYGMPDTKVQNKITIFQPDTVLRYGELGLVLDGIVNGRVTGLSYTNGKGFGVWGPSSALGSDLPAIDGLGNEEALELRIDADFASPWKISALWFTDALSNNNAFASGGWTVLQVSALQESGTDWKNTQVVNSGAKGSGNDPFTFYNAYGRGGIGNPNINALRQDGAGIHEMNKPLSGDNNGLNTHVGGSDVALYLSGISLLMEPEDARSLDLLAPVPLPAPVGMLLAGIGGLAFLRRRQTA